MVTTLNQSKSMKAFNLWKFNLAKIEEVDKKLSFFHIFSTQKY